MKKRIFDLGLAIPALAVAIPLMGMIGTGVAATIGRPIIFKQERRGKDDQPFTIYKFRTMTDACGEDGTLLPDKARHTRFGRFLRKWGLDEMPQLFNIIKGDMSIVGPRPRAITQLMRDAVPANFAPILSVNPGLTSPAQLAMASRGEQLPIKEKLRLDFNYATQQPSLLRDLGVIFRTTCTVLLKGTGSDNCRCTQTIASKSPQP